MKNLSLALIISVTIFSCKNEDNYTNDAELCVLLNEMHKSDQSIRNYPEFIDPFFEILDSIMIANDLSGGVYKALSKEEQLGWGKIAREIAEKRPKASKKVKDSLWRLQAEIDKKNTQLLINITNKRGWPNKEELGCTDYIAPMLIFRHAPEEYWDEIKPIIDKEFAENRMSVGDYKFIDNHLKGRPPLDFN